MHNKLLCLLAHERSNPSRINAISQVFRRKRIPVSKVKRTLGMPRCPPSFSFSPLSTSIEVSFIDVPTLPLLATCSPRNNPIYDRSNFTTLSRFLEGCRSFDRRTYVFPEKTRICREHLAYTVKYYAICTWQRRWRRYMCYRANSLHVRETSRSRRSTECRFFSLAAYGNFFQVTSSPRVK